MLLVLRLAFFACALLGTDALRKRFDVAANVSAAKVQVSSKESEAFWKRRRRSTPVVKTESGATCCCRNAATGCTQKGAVHTYKDNKCCLTMKHACTTWRNMMGKFKENAPSADYCDASTRANQEKDVPTSAHGHCCCKDTNCKEGSVSDSKTIPAQYSPNQNKCCKMKQHACGSWRQKFSGYRKSASIDFCNKETPQDFAFEPYKADDSNSTDDAPIGVQALGFPAGDHPVGLQALGDAPAEPPVYEPGSVGHTLNTYCDFSKHVDHHEGSGARHRVVQQIVDELDSNSIDTMAKEMFSIYMCVRWTATPEFRDMAQGEIDTEQLEKKDLFDHFQDHTFIPLKCTENIKVYNSDKLSETHFVRFEGEIKAQQEWYENEQHTAVSQRLTTIYEARQSRRPGMKKTVQELTGAFDLREVKNRAARCNTLGKPILTDVHKASTADLFNDCAATKWWYTKLLSWHKAMPFNTFMLPQGEKMDDAKPEADEQVMVCFGKRVASQLHRRKDGDHLMTDQNTVGCHGFWSLPMASRMLKRIVDLWRPPTCQLAAMELEFKVKILEMINDMNDRLFDALPSMLAEDEASLDNWDGKPLQSAKGLGVMQGVFNSIVNRFKGLKGKYTRLGTLLGNTVVKWAVCPMKEIDNQTQLDELDSVLGTEDSVARWYARIAYAKHTGEKNLLPGEKCEGTSDGSLAFAQHAQVCELGEMRESMPEPYKNVQFVCPTRPLLPAKQQLEVFKKKIDHCMLRMTDAQMQRATWNYAGHAPTRQQYNKSENLPTENHESVSILSSRSAPDKHFGIWRTFVKLGRHCSEKEKSMTPKFCGVAIHNDQGNQVNLLTKDGMASQVTSTSGSSNSITKWFGRRFRGIEGWLKKTGSNLFGKASTRRKSLDSRFFFEGETGDLVHSMSYQKQLRNSGSDSKDRTRFQRYSVVVPCPNFDAERQFDLTYQWNEVSLELLRKVGSLDGHVAALEVRGRVELNQASEEKYSTSYTTVYRVGKLGDGANMGWSKYERTTTPIIGSLTGALDSHNDQSLSRQKFKGWVTYFACGTRVAVHSLPDNLSTRPAEWSGKQSLKACIQEGVKKNEAMRKATPGEPFYENEIVLRITSVDLSECDASAGAWVGAQSCAEDNKRCDSTRKVWRSMSGLAANCNRGAAGAKGSSWYMGNALPENMLMTTVMDVADVQAAIKM